MDFADFAWRSEEIVCGLLTCGAGAKAREVASSKVNTLEARTTSFGSDRSFDSLERLLVIHVPFTTYFSFNFYFATYRKGL